MGLNLYHWAIGTCWKYDTICLTLFLSQHKFYRKIVCCLDQGLNPCPLDYEYDTLPMSYWNLLKVWSPLPEMIFITASILQENILLPRPRIEPWTFRLWAWYSTNEPLEHVERCPFVSLFTTITSNVLLLYIYIQESSFLSFFSLCSRTRAPAVLLCCI